MLCFCSAYANIYKRMLDISILFIKYAQCALNARACPKIIKFTKTIFNYCIVPKRVNFLKPLKWTQKPENFVIGLTPLTVIMLLGVLSIH